eukprot:TRINITY_DN16406_c0_g1_i1.p1 TRINITY_DN16406_c0_g1~~TRINITY_DN16406_c0_g1_i1.p1  ORF type:complete len:396 (-),score=79.66 TRINITY_DN16406_c0_g1_i1:26-1213(-)
MSDRGGSQALTFACGAVVGAVVTGTAAVVLTRGQQAQPGAQKPVGGGNGLQEPLKDEPAKAEQAVVEPKKEPPNVRRAETGEVAPKDANEACVGPSSEQAGKASGCAGCPNQSACASGEAKKVDPAVSEIAQKLADVKRKILVLSGKGGVGKSTMSAQLAFGFAARSMDVGLLDVDICGPSLPCMLGLVGQDVHQSSDGWSPVYVDEHLSVMSIGFMLQNQDDAIIWRGPRKNGIIKQFLTDVNWGPMDALIIDTPPGTSDEHLSVVTYLAQAQMDGAVIVTTPQEVSLMDVRKEINFCRKVKLPVLGVIENMSGFTCPHCSEVSDILSPTTGGAEAMCKQMGVPFLGRVPMDGHVSRAGDTGKPLVQLQPNSAVAKHVDAVVSALLEQTATRVD